MLTIQRICTKTNKNNRQYRIEDEERKMKGEGRSIGGKRWRLERERGKRGCSLLCETGDRVEEGGREVGRKERG